MVTQTENNHTAKQTGPSQGSRVGKDCGQLPGDQLPGGLEVDGGHGQPDQCAGSRWGSWTFDRFVKLSSK